MLAEVLVGEDIPSGAGTQNFAANDRNKKMVGGPGNGLRADERSSVRLIVVLQ